MQATRICPLRDHMPPILLWSGGLAVLLLEGHTSHKCWWDQGQNCTGCIFACCDPGPLGGNLVVNIFEGFRAVLTAQRLAVPAKFEVATMYFPHK